MSILQNHILADLELYAPREIYIQVNNRPGKFSFKTVDAAEDFLLKTVNRSTTEVTIRGARCQRLPAPSADEPRYFQVRNNLYRRVIELVINASKYIKWTVDLSFARVLTTPQPRSYIRQKIDEAYLEPIISNFIPPRPTTFKEEIIAQYKYAGFKVQKGLSHRRAGAHLEFTINDKNTFDITVIPPKSRGSIL